MKNEEQIAVANPNNRTQLNGTLTIVVNAHPTRKESAQRTI